MITPNLVNKNIEKIKQIFPDCITEYIGGGQTKFAVDFDKLRQELSGNIVEGDEERYQFTWPGKKQAIITANAPINKTLRPCRDESVDFDNTGNLYIEGDNLDVLKLLREDYLGKIRMIYIDPPYNTGNDFIYEDNFVKSADDYIENSGQIDDKGNCLAANTESNGRFHSDWLNMMYPRLKLSKDLLSKDGAIFISIDAHELDNLSKMCNEIFGSWNFVDYITWFKKASPSNDAQFFSNDCEYILVYAKDKTVWRPKRLPLDQRQIKYYQNPDNDPRGPWNSATYTCNKSKFERPNLYYAITNPNTGNAVYPKESAVWKYSKEQTEEYEAKKMIYWGIDGMAKFPRIKKFLAGHQGVVNRSLWLYEDVGHTQNATIELKNYSLPFFPTPKPVNLIRRIIQISCDKDSIALDFFSGSATTADAILKTNSEDGGNRKFIMVQLPEKTTEVSDAYREGYVNICQIGEERIRRAGKKILEEQKTNQSNSHAQVHKLDVGFRVLKLDSSNMKDVYYKPSDVKNDLFTQTENNIKEDRTDEDLLFQVMLELAVPLSAKICSEEICGKKVLIVDDDYLIACFDKDITDEVIKDIAKRKPQYFVMRDSSAMDDSVITNFETIFQTYSKDTVRKIL